MENLKVKFFENNNDLEDIDDLEFEVEEMIDFRDEEEEYYKNNDYDDDTKRRIDIYEKRKIIDNEINEKIYKKIFQKEDKYYENLNDLNSNYEELLRYIERSEFKLVDDFNLPEKKLYLIRRFNKQCNKYSARCQVNKKQNWLGLFETLEQAEIAVKMFRQQHHGEYANHG